MFEVDAKVIAVKDGDTFVAMASIWFNLSALLSVRIAGIDTPELTSHDPEIRADAVAAREWLTKRLGERSQVVLKAYKLDHFGRVIADVFIDGTSVADELLELGLAVHYKEKLAAGH